MSVWFAVPIASAADKDDELWAIRCASFKGGKRFDSAKRCQDSLKKVKGLKADWVQVFDEEGASNVYYGKYRCKYDTKTNTQTYDPDPDKDMAVIRTLTVKVRGERGEEEVWPFRLATMSALPGPASRFPQWEMSNAKGYFSLQVGVFYNTGDFQKRRWAAEEYCQELRKQGEEAWFHHGTVNSSVCIGAFPKDAIQKYRRENSLSGVIEFYDKIVDEKLLALQRKFPHNLQNGHRMEQVTVDPKTGQKKKEPHLSFAVEIPRKKPEFGGLGG